MSNFLRNRTCWKAVAVAAIGLASTEIAWAQYGQGMPYVPRRNNANNPNARNNIPAQRFEGTGTIEAVAPGGLRVNLNGNSGIVRIDPNKTKVEVTGMADPAFLKPGLLVRLSTEFDKKGNASAPINELDIVTAQTAMMPERTTTEDKKAALTMGPSGPVIGQLESVKNNEISIKTNRGSLKGTLGPNPSIKVDINDYSVAQSGDKVDVEGMVSAQGVALASKVTIKLSNPLGADAAKKKPAAKTADKTASK